MDYIVQIKLESLRTRLDYLLQQQWKHFSLPRCEEIRSVKEEIRNLTVPDYIRR